MIMLSDEHRRWPQLGWTDMTNGHCMVVPLVVAGGDPSVPLSIKAASSNI